MKSFSFFFAAFFLVNQASSQSLGKSLNIKLNKKAQRLIYEQNKMFDTIIVVAKDIPHNIDGETSINHDTATISYSKESKLTSELLIHEYFHLKLITDGYPEFYRSFLQSKKNPIINEEQQYINNWVGYFANLLKHYFFFSDMNKIGYNPYHFLSKNLDSWIQSGNIPHQISDDVLGFTLIQILVETGDTVRVEKFKKLLRIKYSSTGIKLGEELIRVIQSEKTTIDSVQKKLVELLNIFFRNKYLVSIAETREKKYKRFKRPVVIISFKKI
jgi:hypothetical protein